jgi:hypothetical protein
MPSLLNAFVRNLNVNVAAGSLAPIIGFDAVCTQGSNSSRVRWSYPGGLTATGRSPAAQTVSAGAVAVKLCRWGVVAFNNASLMQMSAADLEAFPNLTLFSGASANINLAQLTSISDSLATLNANCSGTCAQVPRNCTFFRNNSGTITGSILDLPTTTWTQIQLLGTATAGGDVTNWHPTFAANGQLQLGPSVGITGAMSGLPKLTGASSILLVSGSGNMSGSFSDLQANAVTLNTTNKTFSDSTNAFPASVKSFSDQATTNQSYSVPIGGGSWSPTLLATRGVVTGDIANLWPGITSFQSFNTATSDFTMSAPPPAGVISTLKTLRWDGGVNHPSAIENDGLIAALAAGSVTNGILTLPRRTTASNADVATLQGRGWVCSFPLLL